MSLKFIASFPRKKLNVDGQKYDLAYITPQLIVCSMPTVDYWRSWYRASGDELKAYLDKAHGTNWHIWNLQEPKENLYPDEFFENRVSRHPMPDHTPPTLNTLLSIVGEINQYLSESESNVAVIHCKAGMGRSGTVTCAYLQLVHDLNCETALATFTEARMRRFFGSGVSIPSQLRYLRYIEKYKRDGFNKATVNAYHQIKITSITLRNPKYADIAVDVESAIKRGHTRLAQHQWDRSLKTSGDSTAAHFVPVGPSLYSPLDAVVSISRAKQIKGVAVTHSTGRVHFNAMMESVDETSSGAEVSLMFSCPWIQLDGISGTWFKGTALCESVEIIYEFTDMLTADALTTATVNAVSTTPVCAELPDTAAVFSPEVSAFKEPID